MSYDDYDRPLSGGVGVGGGGLRGDLDGLDDLDRVGGGGLGGLGGLDGRGGSYDDLDRGGDYLAAEGYDGELRLDREAGGVGGDFGGGGGGYDRYGDDLDRLDGNNRGLELDRDLDRDGYGDDGYGDRYGGDGYGYGDGYEDGLGGYDGYGDGYGGEEGYERYGDEYGGVGGLGGDLDRDRELGLDRGDLGREYGDGLGLGLDGRGDLDGGGLRGSDLDRDLIDRDLGIDGGGGLGGAGVGLGGDLTTTREGLEALDYDRDLAGRGGIAGGGGGLDEYGYDREGGYDYNYDDYEGGGVGGYDSGEYGYGSGDEYGNDYGGYGENGYGLGGYGGELPEGFEYDKGYQDFMGVSELERPREFDNLELEREYGLSGGEFERGLGLDSGLDPFSTSYASNPSLVDLSYTGDYANLGVMDSFGDYNDDNYGGYDRELTLDRDLAALNLEGVGSSSLAAGSGALVPYSGAAGDLAGSDVRGLELDRLSDGGIISDRYQGGLEAGALGMAAGAALGYGASRLGERGREDLAYREGEVRGLTESGFLRNGYGGVGSSVGGVGEDRYGYGYRDRERDLAIGGMEPGYRSYGDIGDRLGLETGGSGFRHGRSFSGSSLAGDLAGNMGGRYGGGGGGVDFVRGGVSGGGLGGTSTNQAIRDDIRLENAVRDQAVLDRTTSGVGVGSRDLVIAGGGGGVGGLGVGHHHHSHSLSDLGGVRPGGSAVGYYGGGGVGANRVVNVHHYHDQGLSSGAVGARAGSLVGGRYGYGGGHGQGYGAGGGYGYGGYRGYEGLMGLGMGDNGYYGGANLWGGYTGLGYGLDPYQFSVQKDHYDDFYALQDLRMYEDVLRLDKSINDSERSRRWRMRVEWETMEDNERRRRWLQMKDDERYMMGVGGLGWWGRRYGGRSYAQRHPELAPLSMNNMYTSYRSRGITAPISRRDLRPLYSGSGFYKTGGNHFGIGRSLSQRYAPVLQRFSSVTPSQLRTRTRLPPPPIRSSLGTVANRSRLIPPSGGSRSALGIRLGGGLMKGRGSSMIRPPLGGLRPSMRQGMGIQRPGGLRAPLPRPSGLRGGLQSTIRSRGMPGIRGSAGLRPGMERSAIRPNMPPTRSSGVGSGIRPGGGGMPPPRPGMSGPGRIRPGMPGMRGSTIRPSMPRPGGSGSGIGMRPGARPGVPSGGVRPGMPRSGVSGGIRTSGAGGMRPGAGIPQRPGGMPGPRPGGVSGTSGIRGMPQPGVRGTSGAYGPRVPGAAGGPRPGMPYPSRSGAPPGGIRPGGGIPPRPGMSGPGLQSGFRPGGGGMPLRPGEHPTIAPRPGMAPPAPRPARQDTGSAVPRVALGTPGAGLGNGRGGGVGPGGVRMR